MFDTENSQDPIIYEVGTDKLTIAFAGLPLGLSEVRHDFYNVTSGAGCSKIFCKDDRQLWYQKGVNAEIDSIPKLQRRLKTIIEEINPSEITSIGISAGAYAALLFGHILGADKVHAFGPQTFLSMDLRERYNIPYEKWGEDMERIYASKPATGNIYYDLRPHLETNNTTEFCIHICDKHVLDIRFALHLAEVPNVRIVEYDCQEHSPAAYLKRVGKLGEVLQGD